MRLALPILGLGILLFAAGRARAQPVEVLPTADPGVRLVTKPPAPEPTRGKVLLLDNDRILEGDIERVEGNYRIRRTIGELSIPVGRGKRLCATLNDALDVMKSQANLKDPDERLRLARWCQVNGLRDHALQEARAALDMRPDHLETVALLQTLQRFAISSNPALPPQAQPTPAPPPRFTSSPKSVDVSNEAFALFTTRVQPILMNTCVQCHSGGRGGGFQLVRSSEGGRVAAQANLTAALEFINVERPVLSPLLLKSVSTHGGAALPPLKGRQSAPFLTLQTWVDQLIAGNPHLKEIRQPDVVSTPPAGTSISARKDYFNDVITPTPLPTPLPTPPPVISLPPPSPVPALPPPDGKTPPVVSRPLPRVDAPPVVAPGPTPAPVDPFDPAEFNTKPKRP